MIRRERLPGPGKQNTLIRQRRDFIVESIIFLITAGVTVLWSVWSYFFWSEKVGVAEESPMRFFILIAPSAWFLLLVFTGWQRNAALRLDLIGMVLLVVFSLLGFFATLITGRLRTETRRSASGVVYGVYNFLAICTVAGAFVARSNPIVLIRLTSIAERFKEMELLSFAWISLDTERQAQDLIVFFNRVLIAVLSYLPIAMLRFLSGARQRRRILRELDRMKRRLEALEGRIDRSNL